MLVLGALEKVDRELRPENYKILSAKGPHTLTTCQRPDRQVRFLNITLINSELSEILNLIVKEEHAGAAAIGLIKFSTVPCCTVLSSFRTTPSFGLPAVGGPSTLARELLEKYMSTLIITFQMKKPIKSGF